MQKTVNLTANGDRITIALNMKARTFDVVSAPANGDAVALYGVSVRAIENLQLAIEGLLDQAYKTGGDGQ